MKFKLNILQKIKNQLSSAGGLKSAIINLFRQIGEKTLKIKNNIRFLQNFNWDRFVNQISSPKNRIIVHRFFIITMMCGLTYITGKTIAIIAKSLTSSEKSARSRPGAIFSKRQGNKKEIEAIKNANLFNVSGDELDEILEEKKTQNINMVCHHSTKSSSLPLKLISTVVLQDSVKSIASVQVRSKKKITDIREGDKIENIAEIGRIARQKIILKNIKTGTCEFIVSKGIKSKTKGKKFNILSPKAGKKLMGKKKNYGIENEGDTFKIKKSYLNNILEDFSTILEQAKAIKIQNPDGTLSFKMTEITPGSIYSQLNIQENDIVTGIDGKKIQSVNDLMSMFGRIKNIDQLQLTLERGGSEKTQEYEFE